MMRLSLIALALTGMVCTVFAGGDSPLNYRNHPLTLDEAVQIALKQNASILQQIQQLKAEQGLVLQAQAKLLPQLNATANFSATDPGLTPKSSGGSRPNFDLLATSANQSLTNGVLRGTQNPLSNAPNTAFAVPLTSLSGSTTTADNSWQIVLTASQLLWDGGATIASRRAARITEDAAYYTLRDTIDQVVQTVRTQFFQIIQNRALVQVQEESVNLLQSQLSDQKSRFEAGTVPQFNVLQAQGTLQNQIPQLIQARNNYKISQLTLAQTLGIPADRQYLTENPLPVVGTLDVPPLKYDLGTALSEARANRPSLKAQRSSILSSVENITVQAAGWQPTITASAGLQQQSSGISNNLKDTVQGWFLGVQGSWAIFDGFLTYGRVKEARAQLEQSKVVYDNAVRQVELDVSTVVSNLHQAEQTVESAITGVQVNQEALRLSSERLSAGTGTQLDVLSAQQSLTTARSTLVTAKFSYISAIAQFQFATATETKYNDKFDDPLTRPSTITMSEMKKAVQARSDSPLDPGKPATTKSKREALMPPQGKFQQPVD
jgi:outer membrane protein TolC